MENKSYIFEYLDENNYTYMDGCLLVGIRLYSKNN